MSRVPPMPEILYDTETNDQSQIFRSILHESECWEALKLTGQR